MGFFSKLIEITSNVFTEIQVREAHPSLREAYRYFDAKGYVVANQTSLTMVLRKDRLVGPAIVQLKVLEDGSVEVIREGTLTASGEVWDPAPGAPTVAEFLLSLEKETNAHDSASSSPAPEGSTSWALTVLGLTQGASSSDIRTSYRARLVEYHPDKYATAPVEFRQVAQARTVEITAAYQVLTGSEVD